MKNLTRLCNVPRRWDRSTRRYKPQTLSASHGLRTLFGAKLDDDLLADVGSGHNIRATLYEQAGSMYRADGPEELKSLGETEFVCGVAAMSASGNYGPTRCIAGVVGYVDLRLASRAKGRARATHRHLRRPHSRHSQRLDLERRSGAQGLRRGRRAGIVPGQETS